MTRLRFFGLLVSGVTLAACGGGGSGGDDGGGSPTPTTVSINPASLDEGDNGSSSLAFTVSLNQAANSDVTVAFETADSSATASDYVAASGTVTVSAGATSTTIAVDVLGDTEIETDEEFTVALSNAVNASIGTGVAVGTIVNDDFVLLSISDASIDEGDGGSSMLNFAVTLDRPAIDDVTVDFASSNVIAEAGDDYAAGNDTLTIPAGDTLAVIGIEIFGDTNLETDEQLIVNLLNPSDNAEIADDEGIGLIVNDDLPVVQINPASTIELDAGTRSVAVGVESNGTSAAEIIINYTTENGTAIAGSDYTNSSGSVTIAAGDTTASIPVDVIGDTVEEDSEAFQVRITSIQGMAELDPSRDRARVTILDNDGAASGPQLFALNAGEEEGDSGSRSLSFVILLDEAQGNDVSVDYSTADVSAVAPGDYTAASGTATIVAGETETTVEVSINGDTDPEPNESLQLTLSNATPGISITTPTRTGSIIDDDTMIMPVPRIRIENASVLEGDSGTTDMSFSVSLSEASTSVVTVDYVTQADSATEDVDYTATSGTLSFGIGETGKTIDVPIVGDTFSEDDETFRVRLSGLTGDAQIERGLATGTILTDEPIARVSIADASQLEGDAGSSDLLFTVTLTVSSVAAVSFDYATSDGTATAGEDYTAISGSAQIAAGDTQLTLAVPVSGDPDNEPDETFALALSNLSLNASFVDENATGTLINDDGSPGWQAPEDLGRGREPDVAMDANGNGVAVFNTDTDPALLDDAIGAALFENGAWQAPTQIAQVSTRIDEPRAAMLDSGKAVALYSNLSVPNFESSIYTPGSGWAPQEIFTERAFNYDLASNASGDAIAVWEDPGNNNDPSDILRNEYTVVDGRFLGSELVETNDVIHAQRPLVAIDDAGNKLVYWRQDGAEYNYYDATLAQWTGAGQIPDLLFASNESLTMIGDGRAAIAVRQRGFANNPDSVEVWIYDPGSDEWTVSGPVENEADEDAVLPAIVADDAGNLFVSFLLSSSGFYDLYVNRYDAAADAWGGPVNVEGGNKSVWPSVTTHTIDTDASGNAIIVWSQDVAPPGEFHYRIRAARYSATDDEWSPAEQIDDETIDTGSFVPRIAMDDAGNAIVVWDYDDEYLVGTARYIAP